MRNAMLQSEHLNGRGSDEDDTGEEDSWNKFLLIKLIYSISKKNNSY